MAHFELWLCARQVLLVGQAAESLATQMMLNACVCMLRSAAVRAAQLSSGGGHDMAAFEAACLAIERQLHSAASRRTLSAATTSRLPKAGSARSSTSYRLPSVVLPPVLQPGLMAGDLDAARRSQDENLGWLPMLPAPPTATSSAFRTFVPFPQLLSSLQAWGQSEGSVETQLALCTVEGELFQRAAQGFDSSAIALADDVADQAALLTVVDAYRTLLRSFLASPAGRGRMQVEGRSREVLVVWVAYCLMDAAARKQHSGIMGGYGVALHWQDLRHLVLSDREAVSAALAVSAYLSEHTVPDRELFSLRDQGYATFAFAQAYAAADTSMKEIMALEVEVAEARRQTHWEEVQDKQRLAARLRSELHALQQALPGLSSANAQAGAMYRASRDCRGLTDPHLFKVYNDSGAALKSRQSEISCKEAELKSANTPPPPVLQPLPKRTQLAFGWLFFLHMPPLFRRMSRASFLAQQMLLPVPPGSHAEQWSGIKVAAYTTSLADYYNQRRLDGRYATPAVHGPGSDGEVSLQSRGEVCITWPTHVDSFLGLDHGVWHPDSLPASMGWKGSASAADSSLGLAAVGFFNPFVAVRQDVLELSFTEELRNPLLQFTMHTRKDVTSTPRDRSNLAVARQDAKPIWLSKPAWMTFCSLRSYPVGQLRRLCDALRLRELPFAQPDVVTLIRQAMYHIGTLSPSADGLLWRTDWQPGGDMLPTLCRELQELASDLKHAPRDQDAALLLGELAAYLSMWHPPCRGVARNFSEMTSSAAFEMDGQIEDAAANPASQQQLQARQCRLRMISLLSYGPGAIDCARDAAAVVLLMVLIKHHHIFLDDVSAQEATELQSLHCSCHGVMARHAALIIKLVSPEVFTDAVATILERTPDTLSWDWFDDSGSFESVGPDGHLYSINLLDGTVLLDGLPPGRLPKGVLSHPLYQRTFGDRNFEVSHTASGVLETLKPVEGMHYNFLLAQGKLAVTELDNLKVCINLDCPGSPRHRLFIASFIIVIITS